jgi:hypothetical protein
MSSPLLISKACLYKSYINYKRLTLTVILLVIKIFDRLYGPLKRLFGNKTRVAKRGLYCKQPFIYGHITCQEYVRGWEKCAVWPDHRNTVPTELSGRLYILWNEQIVNRSESWHTPPLDWNSSSNVKLDSELIPSRSPVGHQMSQGEKNVLLDRDSNPEPSDWAIRPLTHYLSQIVNSFEPWQIFTTNL